MATNAPPSIPIPIPTAIRLAQASAILLAATTAGASASLSFFVVPQILASSGRSAGEAARAWASMYAVASRLFPAPMVVVPALLNGFLAWRAGGRIGARHVYVYAAIAAATLSIVPYTCAALGPIDRQLAARSARYNAAAAAVKRERESERRRGKKRGSKGGGDGSGSYKGKEGEEEEEREREQEFVETRQDRETTHALVDQWGVRNLYRSAVSLLAGCAGLYAALS
ncbi:hypothetical protein SLS62_009146 [Diatrype stigma]|uniref:DUF1772-domain-containing protein n=1 Tax=Diatrype stigma TaxID=117547 RepID=A0AAN9UF77_9PEZI